MANSTGGAVKAFIEAQGLGIAAYAREAPQGVAMPYLTIQDGITVTPETAFPAHDDPEGHVAESVQVDVWQLGSAESFTLPDAVARAFLGANLTGLPSYGPRACQLDHGPIRVPDPDPNVVHHAVTLLVHRTLARRP